jgi:hypothetical protein
MAILWYNLCASWDRKVALHRLLFCAKPREVKDSTTLSFIAIFFFPSVGWIAALNPARHISQYSHTAWRVQEGYFSGQAPSITQTPGGGLQLAE